MMLALAPATFGLPRMKPPSWVWIAAAELLRIWPCTGTLYELNLLCERPAALGAAILTTGTPLPEPFGITVVLVVPAGTVCANSVAGGVAIRLASSSTSALRQGAIFICGEVRCMGSGSGNEARHQKSRARRM